MFSFTADQKPASKCFFTYFSVPESVTAPHKPAPRKQKHLSALRSLSFAHTISLILPAELYDLAAQQLLESPRLALRYARVRMSLLEILSGDFFNEYVKSGNVLMRSEGRDGVDHLFTLCEGVLRLEVDHATYERCGLVGKPISSGGRKHVKSRWCIEQNLRLPSMVTGKPGFDRIKWACKNVLNSHLTWLFVDLNAQGEFQGPITAFHPTLFMVRPGTMSVDNVQIPLLEGKEYFADPSYQEQLLDWFGMVLLNSPRIYQHDVVDSYLSLWRLPEAFIESSGPSSADTPAEMLRVARWRGLVSTAFAAELLTLAQSVVGQRWAALCTTAFDGGSYVILLNGSREVATWQLPANIL